MVTHNPDLAETYATRIVRLQDGQIISDSDPYHPEQEMIAEHKNMGRSSMSFLTALGLSFNNLRTKKIRTLLTAFAGSIGIIGIALILSLSNGVNRYIADIQEETLSEYPLTISRSEIDFVSMMESSGTIPSEDDKEKKSAEVRESPTIGALFSGNKTNDLKSFKTFLDSKKSGIKKHANAVEYKYNITPHIFRLTDESHYRQINPDTSLSKAMTGASSDSYAGTFSSMGMMSMGSLFNMLPAQKSLYEKQYKVMAGHWPKDESECVLVLSGEGLVTDLCDGLVGKISRLGLSHRAVSVHGVCFVGSIRKSFRKNLFTLCRTCCEVAVDRMGMDHKFSEDGMETGFHGRTQRRKLRDRERKLFRFGAPCFFHILEGSGIRILIEGCKRFIIDQSISIFRGDVRQPETGSFDRHPSVGSFDRGVPASALHIIGPVTDGF